MSVLRKSFDYDGVTWRLLYDPNDPQTMLPNLSGKCTVEQVRQDTVLINGREQFMTVVDLLYPSVNTTAVRRPAQRVRGFRLSSQRIDPYTVPPETMVMYVCEVQSSANNAQGFLDAIMQAQSAPAVRADDVAWTAQLHEVPVTEPTPRVVPSEEQGVPRE